MNRFKWTLKKKKKKLHTSLHYIVRLELGTHFDEALGVGGVFRSILSNSDMLFVCIRK